MINILDFVHILGSGPTDSGLVVGAIVKAKLGLQPKMFDEACYAYWQGGDFTKGNETQGDQHFCQANQDPHDQHD